MSTKLNDKNAIVDSFNSFLDSLLEQDKLDNKAKLLMLCFLDIVERKREKLGRSRKELAKNVGTSASYIA